MTTAVLGLLYFLLSSLLLCELLRRRSIPQYVVRENTKWRREREAHLSAHRAFLTGVGYICRRGGQCVVVDGRFTESIVR